MGRMIMALSLQSEVMQSFFSPAKTRPNTCSIQILLNSLSYLRVTHHYSNHIYSYVLNTLLLLFFIFSTYHSISFLKSIKFLSFFSLWISLACVIHCKRKLKTNEMSETYGASLKYY